MPDIHRWADHENERHCLHGGFFFQDDFSLERNSTGKAWTLTTGIETLLGQALGFSSQWWHIAISLCTKPTPKYRAVLQSMSWKYERVKALINTSTKLAALEGFFPTDGDREVYILTQQLKLIIRARNTLWHQIQHSLTSTTIYTRLFLCSVNKY